MHDELIQKLIRAIKVNDISIFKDLTSQEIDNLNQYGYSPLRHASRMGRYEIVKYLLEKGVNINLLSPNKHSALIRAALTNQQDIIRLLILNNADITIVTSDKKTFIDYLSRYTLNHVLSDDYEIQKILIAQNIFMFLNLLKIKMKVHPKIYEEYPHLFSGIDLGML